uniref:Uncharacterized protein n=1 Tax=Anopheles coluzzii TaxID=1518534 RepID=A0A8W7PSJ9_ANOCL
LPRGVQSGGQRAVRGRNRVGRMRARHRPAGKLDRHECGHRLEPQLGPKGGVRRVHHGRCVATVRCLHQRDRRQEPDQPGTPPVRATIKAAQLRPDTTDGVGRAGCVGVRARSRTAAGAGRAHDIGECGQKVRPLPIANHAVRRDEPGKTITAGHGRCGVRRCGRFDRGRLQFRRPNAEAERSGGPGGNVRGRLLGADGRKHQHVGRILHHRQRRVSDEDAVRQGAGGRSDQLQLSNHFAASDVQEEAARVTVPVEAEGDTRRFAFDHLQHCQRGWRSAVGAHDQLHVHRVHVDQAEKTQVRPIEASTESHLWDEASHQWAPFQADLRQQKTEGPAQTRTMTLSTKATSNYYNLK